MLTREQRAREVGLRVQRARKIAGLSQLELARAVGHSTVVPILFLETGLAPVVDALLVQEVEAVTGVAILADESSRAREWAEMRRLLERVDGLVDQTERVLDRAVALIHRESRSSDYDGKRVKEAEHPWDETKWVRDKDGQISGYIGDGGDNDGGKDGGGNLPPPEKWREHVDPADFVRALGESKRSGFLSSHKPEDLANHRLILSEDGKVGCAVSPEGDIGSLFNNSGRRGAGWHALLEAIHRGGVTLDCYDVYLPSLYAQFGFTETGRLYFDRNQAGPNWNYQLGEPDLVFMARTRKLTDDEIKRNLSGPSEHWKSEQTDKRFTTWDEAKAHSRRTVGH